MFWVFLEAPLSVFPCAASTYQITVVVWVPHPHFFAPLSPCVIGYLEGREHERDENKRGGGGGGGLELYGPNVMKGEWIAHRR